MKKILVVLSLLLFSLISCHSKDNQIKKAEYDFRGLPLAEKDESQYKQNPAAKQAYHVKVEIQGAPGPLKIQRFWMQHISPNCSYMTSRLAGATGNPHIILDVDYQQKGENHYEGVVYLDGMLDEDYYGQGVCHWVPVAVSLGFKATGAEEETSFNISASPEDILAQKTIKRYYLNRRYPVTILEDGTVFENNSDSGLKEFELGLTISKDQTFTMTMSIEEVAK